jgi:hypothetical protein
LLFLSFIQRSSFSVHRLFEPRLAHRGEVALKQRSIFVRRHLPQYLKGEIGVDP